MVVGSGRRGVLTGAGALAIGLSILPVGGSARADVMRASPDRFVAGLADRVMAALADRSASAEQRLRRVDALVIEGFDLDRIARIALGRYWKTATDAERAEFATLFKAYVLNSYGRRFNDYADRRLRVVAARPAGEDMSRRELRRGRRHADPARLAAGGERRRLARARHAWSRGSAC